MAKKLTLTKQKANKIAKCIEEGNFVAVACRLNGVDGQLFYLWLREARKPGCKPIYTYFLNKIEEAKAESEARAVDCLRTMASKDIRALQFYMSKRHRERWGDVGHIEEDFSEDPESGDIDETFL